MRDARNGRRRTDVLPNFQKATLQLTQVTQSLRPYRTRARLRPAGGASPPPPPRTPVNLAAERAAPPAASPPRRKLFRAPFAPPCRASSRALPRQRAGPSNSGAIFMPRISAHAVAPRCRTSFLPISPSPFLSASRSLAVARRAEQPDFLSSPTGRHCRRAKDDALGKIVQSAPRDFEIRPRTVSRPRSAVHARRSFQRRVPTRVEIRAPGFSARSFLDRISRRLTSPSLPVFNDPSRSFGGGRPKSQRNGGSVGTAW